MTRPVPRSYQSDVIAGNYAAWRDGVRHVVSVMPTGAGKSVVVGQHAYDDAQTPGQNVIMAHRQELVGQMSLHVARAEVPHRIIAPRDVVAFITAEHRREFGRSFVDPDASTAVAGVDTLISRREVLKPWAQQVKRWTIDEAHHVLEANKWGRAVEMFPNAYGLGVTATPNRADGNGIGDKANGGSGVFGRMVMGPSTRQLIEWGNLCEYEIAQRESDLNVAALKIGESGDFSPKQMREASQQSQIVGDVMEWYIRLAYGKRGIVFATDVLTANEIAAKFMSAGIPAASVSAKTDDAVRSDTIRRFRDGLIWVLVNVDLFGEGFDLPAIEVVSMARPTASLGVYLQQFGRVLRPMPGKRVGLVIDHVSNSHRFGLPDRPRQWSLSDRERRAKKEFDPDEIPLRTCGGCGLQYEAVHKACPYCGWAPVPGGGGRDVEMVDGDLTLLDAAALAAMRKAATIETPEQIWAKVAQATGSDGIGRHKAEQQAERIAAREALANTIATWAGWGRSKGMTDSEMYRRFYFATRGIDVASALGLPKAEMDELAGQITAWIGRH